MVLDMSRESYGVDLVKGVLTVLVVLSVVLLDVTIDVVRAASIQDSLNAANGEGKDFHVNDKTVFYAAPLRLESHRMCSVHILTPKSRSAQVLRATSWLWILVECVGRVGTR